MPFVRRLGLSLMAALTLAPVSQDAHAWLLLEKHAQSIASIALSNSSTTTGLSSGNAVGTLSVSMSPATPIFSYSGTNLHLSASGADSGGVCNGTNGAGNSSFQVGSGDTLETNGTITAGSKAICIAAGETGVPAAGQAFTITVGNLIDAAATYCAANGGGNGSSGSPWQAACITAAVAAASGGDTVFLAAGNWALNTANSPVVISKTINLVGAGSGNTFDAVGHPNNPSPTVLTAPTSQTGQTVTRVFSTGPSDTRTDGLRCNDGAGLGGYIQLTGTNQTVSHIFFDGSATTAGGDYCGTITPYTSTNTTINDYRCLLFNDNTNPFGGETQCGAEQFTNVTVKNSIVAQPIQLTIPTQCSASSQQLTVGNGFNVSNTYFYQSNLNPIYIDNLVYTGNVLQNKDDSFCTNAEQSGTGPPGGALGANAPANGLKAGNFHFSFTNSYFLMGGQPYGLGPSVNDPNTNGGVSDLTFTGNWLSGGSGGQVAIDSCVWHYYSPSGVWTGNPNPHYHSCAPNDASGGGMQVNGTQQQVTNNCTAGSTSDPPNAYSYAPGYGFNVSNNSLVSATSSQLIFTGTGEALCYPSGCSLTTCAVRIINTVINPRVNNNYMSSPANILLTDSDTLNATINNNFCAQSSPSFSGCITTGFTTTPTVSFTLSPLGLGGTVPFATTNFTAQYGAVKWIASTSSTLPGSGDSRWSFTPPVSLSSVAHGNTVYLWGMDSANHIGAATPVLIP